MLKYKFIFIMLLVSIEANCLDQLDINAYQALTSDRRAFRVGEPLVILVVESTNAESTAGTGVKRELDIQAGASGSTNTSTVGLELSRSGEGSGQTVRTGRATTQLSATVVEVLPNQMLNIVGSQNLIINGENQKIELSGLIRVEDISKDNSIMSNRIANAKIEIDGYGDVSNAQKQGLISKVLQWLNIF